MPEFIYQPPHQKIEILFNDDDLLVANKPSGLLSVPGRLTQHKDNLLTRLELDFGTLHCVHRLDMDTSGLMLVARNKKTLSHLARQFQQRQIQKTYQAIVYGKMEIDHGEISAPLITDWPNRPRQKICEKTGKAALTAYQVIKACPNKTYIELYPVTGRSHQLRIHMQSINHPILGCRFYAHKKAQMASERLMLHAAKLGFIHPQTEQQIEIENNAAFWIYPSKLTS